MPGPLLPFVSVVVPTHDRARRLARCLTSLCAQTYPVERYEIVVADDGSSDDTASVVERIRRETARPAVGYVRQVHRGVNAARNLALAHAAGDPVCFVDDDEDVPATWLAALVDGCLRHPEAGCVGGPIRLRYDGRPPRTCGREPLGEGELDRGDRTIAVDYVSGGNMAVRRAALAAVGPFREDLAWLGGTELEWQDRVHASGSRVVYVPEAWVWHVRTAAELGLPTRLRRHFARGRGQALNGRRIGRRFSIVRTTRELRLGLAHALRHRCVVGLVDAARAAGRLGGTAEAAVRGTPRAPAVPVTRS